MSRILVVGGYGSFGARLSRRLANAGHEVLVGGRSAKRAAEFCAKARLGIPIEIDRSRNPGQAIARVSPDLVIDAAGPFQGSGYGLAEVCIEAGCHYLDLADARDFVTGISALDERARQTGVSVVSGASSVPALSHAVVFELAKGLDDIDAIEIAISASSRASAGDSVASAILGGVGQPLRLWQGARWVGRWGWQSIRRVRFALPSGKALRPRIVALADVPDLALLPERVSGVSAVTFRAGTESTFANLGLWLASWAVRWRFFRSLSAATTLLGPIHHVTRLWGTDRSGMIVRLFGRAGGKRIERRWTLIAERGDGPEIPTLAAAILAGRAHSILPGARDAGTLLALADFESSLASLATEQAIVELPAPAPLYARVMGEDFQRLAPAVQRMHDVLRDYGATGGGSVVRGANPIARFIAKVMRFPPSGEYPLHVHFKERDGIELWTRDFGGYRFSSQLMLGAAGHVVEKFGPIRFHFRLTAQDGTLGMQLQRWSVCRLPMPLALGPKAPAREWEESGTFHFEVAVSLPLIGPVIRYRGWLRP